ncbi:MAG: aminotransferase class V-fold PLP-dependent enzyme [Anaerolineae bacterium]|nr:aminotransferase class V-fold PLP-dependent enzyme [Anaerolineae bacterium]
MNPIYLDYNATTPIKREIADAMTPYLYEHFGNPSSAHPFGVQTKAAVNDARDQVAALLGCSPAEIVFTGGGSEANNTAIKGVADVYGDRGQHIITSAIEHPAVSEPCAYLERRRGFRITVIPVDETGRVNPDDVRAAITPETILISIMHANNEVGTIQPIAEIAQIAHEAGALMHVDAAQSVGKIPVKVDDLGADFLTLAGHKLYAPKGIGALYVRTGIAFEPLIHGASHEAGRRAGTENVLQIVGLGVAAALGERDMDQNMAYLCAMRDQLYRTLRQAFGPYQMKLNTPYDPCDRALPNTLSVSFRGVEANTLLAQIGDRVAASAGAACHAGEVTLSKVIAAMGVHLDYAMGTVRLSVGTPTTPDEIDTAAQVIIAAVRGMQA